MRSLASWKKGFLTTGYSICSSGYIVEWFAVRVNRVAAVGWKFGRDF
jgi:hypothetical protein